MSDLRSQARHALKDMVLEWTLGDWCAASCRACKDVAAKSPFTTSKGKNPIPAWPSELGCGTKCDCSVSPEAKSWNKIMAPMRQKFAADAVDEAKHYR